MDTALPKAESTEVAVCSRCGVFLTTREETHLVNAKLYCSDCAVRPEINYLERFRLRSWGKRDAWAWLVGIGALFSLAVAVTEAMQGVWLSSLNSLASTVLRAAFFQGQRWARWAILAPVVTRLAMVLANPQQTNGFYSSPALARVQTPLVIGSFVASMLIWVAIIQTTRNKLFFKIEVPKHDLEKAWHLYENNGLARTGLMVSILSLVIWPLGIISLIMSIIGLSRVDTKATPPIGRRGQAIAGIALSSLSLLMLLGLATYVLFSWPTNR